jgi:hypothetical protein
MIIRLTQLDGKLPNLALMRLAHWHRERGDAVAFTRSPYRHLDEPDYDRIYASVIFDYSRPQLARLLAEFPGAIVGGTASGSNRTVENIIGPWSKVSYDDYPGFAASLGFTQRGCRLSCKFCVVPAKEGKPQTVATIADIWRGEGHPKHLHLLDNDFFGQPEDQWRTRLAEIREGGFKVCFNQGLNVRLITAEAARELARVDYRDDSFTTKRLYTAWDNLKDEAVFFKGVETLEAAGVPPTHLLAYMLIGFDKNETWARLFHRFEKMVARGIRPFPMIYGDKHKTLPLGGYNGRVGHRPLWQFQKWVIRRYYEILTFEQFDNNAKRRLDAPTLFEGAA